MPSEMYRTFLSDSIYRYHCLHCDLYSQACMVLSFGGGAEVLICKNCSHSVEKAIDLSNCET